MTLKYGSHHLYFLAHSSTSLQHSEDRTFYPSKVTETFWTDFPLEADENLQEQQTVPMERVVTMVKVTLRDAMPQGVDSIRLTVDGHYRKLDLQTGNAAGSSGSAYSLPGRPEVNMQAAPDFPSRCTASPLPRTKSFSRWSASRPCLRTVTCFIRPKRHPFPYSATGVPMLRAGCLAATPG